MKTTTQKILALILFSTLLFSCAKDDTDELFESSSQSENVDVAISYSQIEYEIVDLINEYRTENGLAKLSMMNIVSKEAGSHTDYMLQVGEVNHDNFGLRHQYLVANASAKSVAENVAYGYRSAESVVNAWLNSPSHKQNIDNASYTDFGISIKSDSEGKNYFTNIFIKR